jgi:hypothetical protein
MLVVLVAATLCGAAIGGAVNCANGAASPQFFEDQVLIWEHRSIWLAAVVHGAAEGALDGVIFGMVFLVVICAATGCRCRSSTLYHSIRTAIMLTVTAWVLGGCCGVVYATLFPHGCPTQYFGIHFGWSSLARYAWVRGSYWGITYGGLLAVAGVAARSALAARANAGENCMETVR